MKSDNVGSENTVKREGRNGLKQEEEKEKEDTNLELVNTRDDGLALAQLCTRDILLPRPTVAP